MARSPADILAEAFAIGGEYRADAKRLKTNIAYVRLYAEDKEAQISGDQRGFRRGMAAAYGDIARKLAVAEHADFNRTEASADEP